ncbi:MAG: tetratricopeptide repeat protein [Burkholderiaceae bacterium]|nr:tetratricopeptide repeat protein [Burkholderiaceae bacterium]
MAYDLQEQESLDELKAWWDKWGTLTMTAVTIVCIGFAAHNGWKWYQRSQAAEAAVAYSSLQDSIIRRADVAQIENIADKMLADTGSTVYAALGALSAAKHMESLGDTAKAGKYLTWVINQSDRSEYNTIARVRMAGLMIDQKRFDEALKLLNDAKPAAKEVAMVKDRMGDIYFAKGDVANARAQWEAAMAQPIDQTLAGFVNLKLQALPEIQK